MKLCLVFIYIGNNGSFLNKLKQFEPKELKISDIIISLINNKAKDS